MADSQIPAALLPSAPIEPAAPQTAAVDLADTDDAVPMFDHANKTLVNVNRADIPSALKSGHYTLPKNYNLDVVNSQGEVGTIPSKTAAAALNSGEYTVEDTKSRAQRILQQKYGSDSQELLAGAAGAARGLSFGASDQALVHSGLVKPETLHGLEEANPVASGIGEYGAIGASMLWGQGEANVAAKAAGAGLRAAEAAGGLTERAVAKGMLRISEKAGLKSSVAKAIVEKIAPRVAGSAVEGAAFGAGSLISEDALGTADFNAENLLAEMGVGALLGGSIGGVLEAAAPLVKKGFGAADDLVGRNVREGVEATLDKNENAAKYAGFKTPTQMHNLKTKAPDVYDALPSVLKDDVGIKLTDSAGQASLKVTQANEAAGKAIGEIVDDINAISKNYKGVSTTNQEFFSKIADDLKVNHLKPYEGTPGYESILKPVQDYVAALEAKAAIPGELTGRALQEYKTLTQKLVNFEKTPGKFTPKDEAVLTARRVADRELKEMADRASAAVERETPELAKSAANLREKFTKANKVYRVTETVMDNFEKKADKTLLGFGDVVDAGIFGADGIVGKAVVATKRLIDSDFKRKVIFLGKIEKAQQSMAKVLDKSVDGFFSATKVVEPLVMRSLIESKLSTDEKGKKPKDKQQAFLNMQANLNRLAANPEGALALSNRQTAALYDAAPQTSGSLDIAAMRAASFLQSKLPKSTQNVGAIQAIQKPRPPSNLEVSKFARYVEAVENPKSVFQDLARGQINREGVEALQVVYPELYKGLQTKVMDQVTKDPDNISYQKRLQLGILLHIPTDTSLNSDKVLGLQALFGPQDSGNGTQDIRMSGVEKSEKSNRLKTTTQRGTVGE